MDKADRRAVAVAGDEAAHRLGPPVKRAKSFRSSSRRWRRDRSRDSRAKRRPFGAIGGDQGRWIVTGAVGVAELGCMVASAWTDVS